VPSEATLAGAPLLVRTSGRARRIRLRLDPRSRSLILTVPRRESTRRALAWAAGQRDWAAAAIAALPRRAPVGPGSVIPFLGTPHRIDWHGDQPRRISAEAGALRVGGPLECLEARLTRWLKKQALDLLSGETSELATIAGVRASRVAVGDPISRWGSCSSRGAIRYSWRLILAPAFVRRATVAHEVAHLIHMDHGPAFHALVAEILGADPAPARAWLRREGASLHVILPH
jgi:predicted metal-dependent hydrolase